MNSTGSIVARYTFTQNIDEPLAMQRSGSTSYYQADALGSVTSLTSSTGSVANTYTYDSFGNVTNSTGSLRNPFLFAGREYDNETSLYFNRARYYNASTGRFISEDPIRFWGGVNFYGYVFNSPANLFDPLGLCGKKSLSVRAPGQSFNDCMRANAGNYSLLGVADFALDANGQIANNFWLGFTPASNTVTNVYNTLTGSLPSLLQTGPRTVTAGMGTVVTYGRRTSSIMSLNLAGTPGGPQGGFPALGSPPSNAARAGKAAAGFLKLAIDTGLFLAEAAGCR